jgi:nicotinamide-nucleotide amidase
MLDDDIVKAAEQLLAICKRKNLLVATAESCTAGLIAGTLSEVPGVSSILDRGYITYSNEAKHEMLGVPREVLDRHGAVSRQTAEAMVRGVLGHARVHLAVSVTGIAGPDGGSEEKPVGLVWFALVDDTGAVTTHRGTFPGQRPDVLSRATMTALSLIWRRLEHG